MTVPAQAFDFAPATIPYNLGTVTTADGQLVVIPSEMSKRFCVFQARGQDVFIRFGIDDTVDVDPTDVNTLSSGVLQADAAKAPHLYVPAGQARRIRIPAEFTHFAHVSTATGGFLYFGVATGDGTSGE